MRTAKMRKRNFKKLYEDQASETHSKKKYKTNKSKMCSLF